MIDIENVNCAPELPDMSKDYLNDFSFWYPKVKDCGIRQPESVVFRLPAYNDSEEAARLYEAFYLEHYKEDMAVIQSWVDKNILPELAKSSVKGGFMFVKNGRFSNKFDANESCITLSVDLARHIARINYEAACVDSGGENEIVIRSFIPYDRSLTPCIYNGLPLRPEFRVFYDFDKRKVIFTVNYWDFEYVYPHLYNATDKIIFQHERDKLNLAFNTLKPQVERLVEEHMRNVEGLDGQWSVDIMLDIAEDDYNEKQKQMNKLYSGMVKESPKQEPFVLENHLWLIDMAIAQRSAYWELRPSKLREE